MSRRMRVGATMVAAVLLLSGCIGVTERAEFEQVIRDRGGGVTVELFAEAIDAVEQEVGADGLIVRRLDASPVDGIVTVTVRDPDQAGRLDTYTVRRGAVGDPSPVSLDPDVDLDATTFPLADVAFERIETMADEALERFGEADAWVERVEVSTTGRPGPGRRTGDPGVTIWLSAPRADAVAEFTAEGDLVEVVPR